MKILFAHSHPFGIDKDGLVRSNQLPYVVWQRYLKYADEVTVFARQRACDAGIESWREASGPNVRFVLRRNSGLLSNIVDRRLAQQQLRTLVDGHDGVVARLPSEYGLMALRLARELGKPSLAEIVGCAGDAVRYHGRFVGRLYSPIYALRTRRAVVEAGHLIYVSSSFLQERYPPSLNSLTAVASNVDLPDSNADTLARRLASIGTDRGPLVIGMIGSPGLKYKGVHVAIGALAKLVQDRNDVHLRVAGAGSTDSNERLARSLRLSDRVSFDGVVPQGFGVMDWLDGIDVYIQPSLTEGVPRSLIEAMSRACPCVGSNVGGIPEVLAPEFTVPSGDDLALASAIESLISNPERMAQAARANFDISKRFSSEALEKARASVLKPFQLAAKRASDTR